MQLKTTPYSDVPFFSARDKAYVAEVEALRPFYKYSVELASFKQVIEDKKQDATDRATLVEVLLRQHATLNAPNNVLQNIERLRQPNAFTIITAHQPSLFTGPLYYIFKIISAINLAKNLKAAYPENEFVPIFITSGEDHDFEEVNHLHLFNKTLTWQSGESGPVGHMSVANLQPVLEELKGILGESEYAKHIYSLIENTHSGKSNYAEAAYQLAHELFKKEGLVVLNTNDAGLKRLFIPIIKEEIFNQVSKPMVEAASQTLIEAGFSPQATPRDINFFYLKGNIRERIVLEEGVYKVLNTNFWFSKEEMEKEIDEHPERFSPNVIMRPLYQELTMPNLAYVGGGGEIAYWLERKSQFAHFGINFPMLVRRDSAMFVDKTSVKKMGKAQLGIEEVWKDKDVLVREFIAKHGSIEISLGKEKEELKKLYEGLAAKAKATNPNLEKMVLAEHAKAKKSLDQIETRLLRAEKQAHENGIAQIHSVQERLFPKGGLQERYENFLPYYLKYGDDFFEILKKHFNPLDKQFKIFVEADEVKI